MSSHIIVNDTVCRIIGTYLEKISKKHPLFRSIRLNDYITRLLTKRPNAFMKGMVYTEAPVDTWLIETEGQIIPGHGEWPLDWINISPEQVAMYQEMGITVDKMISRIEMTLGSLITMGQQCDLINNGSRFNNGKPMDDTTFHPNAIYVGSVGARYEDPMAFAYAISLITPNTTSANGYGRLDRRGKTPINDMLDSFAYGFEIPYFPTHSDLIIAYENAIRDDCLEEFNKHYEIIAGKDNSNYVFFSKDIYRKLIYIPYYETIKYADFIGQSEGKPVLLHFVGLGTGVWAIAPDTQNIIIREVINDICKSDIKNINLIRLAWMGDVGTTYDNIAEGGNKITMLCTGMETEPAQPMPEDMERLLIIQFAWDSGSFPGNEYYFFKHNIGDNSSKWRSSSGDPAAVVSTKDNSLAEQYMKGMCVIKKV